MSGSLLRVEHEDGLCVVTLARTAKMNALSAELVEQLIGIVEEAPAQGAQALVLQGDGNNFSAGFDFGDWRTQSEGDLLLRFVRIETLLQRVAASPCLTVAYAHGRNFGAGVDLFAACRLRYASADATFRMPGLKFGLVLGTRRFSELVGVSQAHDVLNASRTFSGQDALQMGFVDQLLASEQWPALRAQTLATATSLDPFSRRRLYEALSIASAHRDSDLAMLVRSAAQPGLKRRIEAYLGDRS